MDKELRGEKPRCLTSKLCAMLYNQTTSRHKTQCIGQIIATTKPTNMVCTFSKENLPTFLLKPLANPRDVGDAHEDLRDLVVIKEGMNDKVLHEVVLGFVLLADPLRAWPQWKRAACRLG